MLKSKLSLDNTAPPFIFVFQSLEIGTMSCSRYLPIACDASERKPSVSGSGISAVCTAVSDLPRLAIKPTCNPPRTIPPSAAIPTEK